ncbi:MAG: class I SAM-dependent methyltransferase [Cohaesibacter sp.]|nr:class I SAM-dependent methyltransferase [Cohaesibacter sp.]
MIDDLIDGETHEERKAFFDAVYIRADGDDSKVPWSGDDAKPEVLAWLDANPAQEGMRALDIATGLGEHAQALARANYKVTAFDLADEAINWAKERFPDQPRGNPVTYVSADLFDLPQSWGQFDLVHECYTIQSLPDDIRAGAFDAIANCVAPGGTLLVYARTREEGLSWDQAPWPLMPSEFLRFEQAGLIKDKEVHFLRDGGSRKDIPHTFAIYRKPL